MPAMYSNIKADVVAGRRDFHFLPIDDIQRTCMSKYDGLNMHSLVIKFTLKSNSERQKNQMLLMQY